MENKKLIEQLYLCEAACMQCSAESAAESHEGKLQRCILQCQECAALCRISAQVVTRNSEGADKFLQLCSVICLDCAAECEKHTHSHCADCARLCRECAHECIQYYQHIEK